jgi:hypothetical protein
MPLLLHIMIFKKVIENQQGKKAAMKREPFDCESLFPKRLALPFRVAFMII